MTMEEKKGSGRPTAAQIREMEETVHRQCVELDAWRDRYRELVAELESEREAYACLHDSYEGVRSENEYLLGRGVIARLLNMRG